MVITIKEEGKRFGARVGAIIYNEEQTKILLEKQREDRYMFPGGRIDLYEDSQTAIQRELQEELNIAPSFHLRYIVELFLKSPKTKYHEIGFYFITSILESEIADGFRSLDGDSSYFWIPVDELASYPVLEHPIKEKVIQGAVLQHSNLEHLIARD